MHARSDRKPEILLVEDCPADERLTREALDAAQVSARLHVVGDGVEAMTFLRRMEADRTAPAADIILLDLNLPRKDGREVLAEVKGDPRLARIPVIILSTSDAEQDVATCYGLGANCYVTKPLDLDLYLHAVGLAAKFWSEVAITPSRE